MSKILIVHHSGLIGGAGISLINKIKELSKKNTVITYIPNDPVDIKNIISKECRNVEVHEYGRRIGAITYYSGGDGLLSGRFWYRLLLILKQIRYWNQTIENVDPDVVIVNSTVLCWMSLLRSVRKRKSICFVRETKKGFRYSLLNCIIHYMLRQFTKVIFISRFDLENENLPVDKGEVIYNYIDKTRLDNHVSRQEAEQKLGLGHNYFRILFVGGVSQMKGFDLAVDVVNHLNHSVELLVAGPSYSDVLASKSKATRRYAINMKNATENNNKIRIIGKQEDMSNCYASCDLLLFPMRKPHQARPVFEAGYFNKPVIISDFKNIKEFVVDGVNGFLVFPDDTVKICSRVQQLMEDTSLLKIMGEKNRQRTDENHDSEKSVKILTSVIMELCEKQ